MTFDEWFSKHVSFGNVADDELTPVEIVVKAFCQTAWNAAKEDSKCPISIEKYNYRGEVLFKVLLKNKSRIDDESLYTREQAEKWAIENGYRVEEI